MRTYGSPVPPGMANATSCTTPEARSLLGACVPLVGMRIRLSNTIRGVLKTFGLAPAAGRRLVFDRRVEALIDAEPEVSLIVRPLLEAWRRLGQQIAALLRERLRSFVQV